MKLEDFNTSDLSHNFYEEINNTDDSLEKEADEVPPVFITGENTAEDFLGFSLSL